ncbi:hypothetical protein CLU79DRAFT_748931 [Phycomyces nitens]|nr:hypothetical protein CLU79DRAFT_748931 [Phycomyces nitens]
MVNTAQYNTIQSKNQPINVAEELDPVTLSEKRLEIDTKIQSKKENVPRCQPGTDYQG